MSLAAARTAARTLRDAFSAEGVSPVQVNMGLCADFADALSTKLLEMGISAEIRCLDDFWAEHGDMDTAARRMRERATLPPEVDWTSLGDDDFANRAAHSWVEVEGMAFDSEHIDGVSTAFDLSSIRHALTEIVGEEVTTQLAERHAWWREAQDIAARRALWFLVAPDTTPRPD